MIVKHFTKILYVMGVITMLPLIQFFLPYWVLKVEGLPIDSQSSIFFIRHWGLMSFCIGALLVYAAVHPYMRRGVVIAAAVEKMGMMVMIVLVWNDPVLSVFRPVLFIDGLCVWMFAIYVMSGASSRELRDSQLASLR